jgi:hypothetical protein
MAILGPVGKRPRLIPAVAAMAASMGGMAAAGIDSGAAKNLDRIDRMKRICGAHRRA